MYRNISILYGEKALFERKNKFKNKNGIVA